MGGVLDDASPGWLCVLWTDERLRALTRACYPDCEIMCGENVPGIYLADFGRYMVLHRFGGLYVDLDYECLKNMEPLLSGHQFVTSYSDDSRQELNNALIAAVPDHPLLSRYMDACCSRWRNGTRTRSVSDFVEEFGPGPVTGPVMMTEVTDAFLKKGGDPVTVHDARLLCPIDWRKDLSIHLGTLPPETIARVARTIRTPTLRRPGRTSAEPQTQGTCQECHEGNRCAGRQPLRQVQTTPPRGA